MQYYHPIISLGLRSKPSCSGAELSPSSIKFRNNIDANNYYYYYYYFMTNIYGDFLSTVNNRQQPSRRLFLSVVISRRHRLP